MVEFLTKKIDTYAEFQQAIVQSNIYLDDDDNTICQLLDEFDDNVINAAWVATGSTEANDKINIHDGWIRSRGGVSLPATYNILIRYLVIDSSAATSLAVFANRPDGGAENIRIMSDGVNIYIQYLELTTSTWRYWNGAAWQVGIISCSTDIDGFVRVKKTATEYIITIYNSAYVLQEQATVAFTLMYPAPYSDGYLIGKIAGTAQIDVYFVKGIINDKISTGRFTEIIDLDNIPKTKGNYTENIIFGNLSDSTEQFTNSTATNYSLRLNANIEKISQGFKIPKSGIIEKIVIPMIPSGAAIPNKKVWVEIWTDDGTGKPLAKIQSYTSLKIPLDTLKSYENFNFIFNSPLVLQIGIQYHLVINSDFVIDGVTYLAVWADNAGLYSDGYPNTWNGVAWVNTVIAAGEDIIFGVYLKSSSMITRKISYSDWIAWHTLDSKADFEGHNEIFNNIDTATKAGYVLLEDTGGGIYPFGEPVWTKESLMAVLPSADGWNYIGTAPEATYCSVAGGILTIATVGTGAIMADYEYPAAGMVNATGSTIEAKLKVLAVEGGIGYRCYIGIYDGTKQEQLFISDDRIVLYAAGLTFMMDTMHDYHVYRITLKLTVIRVYVDDVLVMDGNTAAATGGNYVSFGDGEIGIVSNSNVLWDYLKHFVGGAFAPAGKIQNDIDLGAVPTQYCTLSTVYKLPQSTAITFKVAYSDDGAAYSVLASVTVTNGNADLTTFGKHRWWRIEGKLTTSNMLRTPELNAWTIDAFKPAVELLPRNYLEPYRYLKIEINLTSYDILCSAMLYSIEINYREAYELYVKKVKYRISADGILADMELSSI